MTQNRTMLKAALLSSCIVCSSATAIMAIIPEMAKSFPDVELYVIELITTAPALFQMLAILFSGVVVRFLGLKRSVMLGLLLCGVMLGLQGSVLGLGNAASTLLVGQLVAFG